MNEPKFYIALVGEIRTPGVTNPKEDTEGYCQEITSVFHSLAMMSDAISKKKELSFFFTVYVIKSSGETMAVEDFPNLGRAMAEWPDAEVRVPRA